MAKKTPSPKVIASFMIRKVLEDARQSWTDEQLSVLVNSKVSPEKHEKVNEQFEKITASLNKKLEKAIDKFEGSAKAVKSTKKEVAQDEDKDENDEEEEAPKKKKKKKKNK